MFKIQSPKLKKQPRYGSSILPYFIYDDLIEEIRLIQGVVILLSKRHISKNVIGVWLQLAPHDVDEFLKLKQHSLLGQSKVYDREAEKNTKWFLKHRCPIYMSSQIIDYIIELLLSERSARQIAQGTHMTQPFISDLRNGKRQISMISLKRAKALADYYKRHKQWLSWKGVSVYALRVHNLDLIPGFPNTKTVWYFGTDPDTHQEFRIWASKKTHRWQSRSKGNVPEDAKDTIRRFEKHTPIRLRSWNDTQYMIRDLRNKTKQLSKINV